MIAGASLREARLGRGLRGIDVARELNVSQPTLSRWERREELPRRVAYAVLYAIDRLAPPVASNDQAFAALRALKKAMEGQGYGRE